MDNTQQKGVNMFILHNPREFSFTSVSPKIVKVARKLHVLDLFCGAGGVSMGLYEAAHGLVNITGIDIDRQPDYPFNFIQENVYKISPQYLKGFDFIWASPPCQRYSFATRKARRALHPDSIPPTKRLLRHATVPWVIENVRDAPIRKDLMLCGSFFGLGVIRHRYFEIDGFKIPKFKAKCKHPEKFFTVAGGGTGTVKEWQNAMGIFHTKNRKSLRESIPPAYSRFIFSYYLEMLLS